MFKNRTTLFFLLGSTFHAFAFIPSNYLLPQLFQGVRGASALGSGIQLLPYACCVAWNTVLGEYIAFQHRLKDHRIDRFRSWPDQLSATYHPPSRMGRLCSEWIGLQPFLRLLYLPLFPRLARGSIGHRRVWHRPFTASADAHPAGGHASQGNGSDDQCLDVDTFSRGKCR